MNKLRNLVFNKKKLCHIFFVLNEFRRFAYKWDCTKCYLFEKIKFQHLQFKWTKIVNLISKKLLYFNFKKIHFM